MFVQVKIFENIGYALERRKNISHWSMQNIEEKKIKFCPQVAAQKMRSEANEADAEGNWSFPAADWHKANMLKFVIFL